MFIQSAVLTRIPVHLQQDVLLTTLLQTTREGVAIVDQQGVLHFANERLYEWLQLWTHDQQSLSAFVSPAIWQRLRSFLNSSQPSLQSHLDLQPAGAPEIPVQLRAQRLPEAETPHWLLLFSDLRRERQLESTLSGSHDQQFSLLQSLPVPAAIVRMSDSLILQGNEEFANWYGMPLNSLSLQPLHDFFARPSDWLFLLEECRRKAGISVHELQVHNPDGTAVWSQTFAQQITFDGHQALMLVFYDITQHKQLEKSMAWSKRLIQNMMTAQSQFVAKSDPDTIFLHVLDHVLSMTFSEFGFIVSCPQHTDNLQVLAVNHTHWSLDTVETFARGAQREFEALYKARHKLCDPLFSGGLSFCEQADELYYPWMKRFMGIPLYSSGECFGMLGLANSPYSYNELLEMELHPLLVTIGHLIAAWHNDQQRREAEAQLARRNHQLNVLHSDVRQLIDNASVPVFAIDLHGIVREWNTAMVQLSELPSEEMLNGVLLEQILSSQTPLDGVLEKVRQGRAIENLELHLKRANGQSLRLLTSLTPRRNENGDLIGAWGMGQNITSLADYQEWLQLEIKKKTHALQTALFEQRQMTTHLSQMLEKEAALFALRDRFAAVASHEFRGPLAAIQIAAENLCNPDVQLRPEQVDRKVQRIKKRADQLHYLVHDILLLTQLDAGHLSFHPEPCQLHDFCEQVIEEVQIATQASHRIHASYPSLQIWMDQRLMRLILSNLLHNAIKFSLNHFEIWLRIYPDHQQTWLCFEVEDRGLGITEQEAEEIFKPFFRSPRVVHQTSGMGLGLDLVRRCLDLHQGEIEMQAQEQGTLFRVKIPYRV